MASQIYAVTVGVTFGMCIFTIICAIMAGVLTAVAEKTLQKNRSEIQSDDICREEVSTPE